MHAFVSLYINICQLNILWILDYMNNILLLLLLLLLLKIVIIIIIIIIIIKSQNTMNQILVNTIILKRDFNLLPLLWVT